MHGDNGFGGHVVPPAACVQPAETTAAQYIVETINARPGDISILALGPLTNIALAVALDPSLPQKWRELVLFGGAVNCNGNVNPAAEANFVSDPLAADRVLGAGGKIRMVGLDVSLKLALSGDEVRNLRGKGKLGTFLADISGCYLDYHKSIYGREEVGMMGTGHRAEGYGSWAKGWAKCCSGYGPPSA